MWTAEQARTFSRVGAEASVLSRRMKALAPAEPKPEPNPDTRASEVLDLIRLQIKVASKALLHDKSSIECEHCGKHTETELSPRDRALLLGALDRLLERERVWSQRAGPGNLKPTSQRQRSGPPTPTV